MLSQADQSALDAYEAQITQLEGSRGQQDGAADAYSQQMDNWLAEIKKQLGADDGGDGGSTDPAPGSTSGGTAPASGSAHGGNTEPTSGSASGGSTAPTGQGSDTGTGSASDSQSSFDQNLSKLQLILAEKGASPEEQDNAMLGAQEANGTYGNEPMTLLLQAAQQDGYHGVEIVMTAFEDAKSQGLNTFQFTLAGLSALKLQQLGGDGAANAYIEALAGNGGLDGANKVLSAAQDAQAQGDNAHAIADTAWGAAIDSQQQGLAATQDAATQDNAGAADDALSTDATADPPSSTGASTVVASPDLTVGAADTDIPLIGDPSTIQANINKADQDYDTFLNDVESGAGKEKTQADASQLMVSSIKIGDIGTAEVAMLQGGDFTPDGTPIIDRNILIDVLKQVDPRSTGAALYYDNLDPLTQAYFNLGIDVAIGADPSLIKKDADNLWGKAIANNRPALGNAALNISRTVGDNSYSQTGSLVALMGLSLNLPDPAEHGFGGASSTSTPPANTDDEAQAYQVLTDGLNNNADPKTIVTDSLALSAAARKKGDYGMAETALHIGQHAQTGSLDKASSLTELQKAAPGTDDARTPPALQWTPPQ